MRQNIIGMNNKMYKQGIRKESASKILLLKTLSEASITRTCKTKVTSIMNDLSFIKKINMNENNLFELVSSQAINIRRKLQINEQLSYCLLSQYSNLIMDCPLQNIRLIQSITQQVQPTSAITNNKNTATKGDFNQVNYCSINEEIIHDKTPFFFRYQEQQKTPLKSQVKSVSKQSNQNQLIRYLQSNESDQQIGDYSSELKQLKQKLIEIEQISHKQIDRLKQQLQQQKQKQHRKRAQVQSIGVNTQQDHKNDQIAILKQMLRQQCMLNKQLLKQSIRNKQNIYQAITITKN